MFFSPEGILDIDAGDGGGVEGGALGPQNPPKLSKKYFVRKSLTLLGPENQKCRKMSKNIFKIGSHIQ